MCSGNTSASTIPPISKDRTALLLREPNPGASALANDALSNEDPGQVDGMILDERRSRSLEGICPRVLTLNTREERLRRSQDLVSRYFWEEGERAR